jgi:hypothetical protein
MLWEMVKVVWLDVDGENVTNIHSQNTVNSFGIKRKNSIT